MKKIAAGDRTALGTLCSHLADRLLYVPVIDKKTASGTTQVTIVRFNEDGISLIPAFTNEKNFRTWKQANKHAGDSFSLIGADLCVAIGEEAHLVLDPGQESSIRLGPDEVRKVVQVAQSDEEEEQAQPAESTDWAEEPTNEDGFEAPWEAPPATEPASLQSAGAGKDWTELTETVEEAGGSWRDEPRPLSGSTLVTGGLLAGNPQTSRPAARPGADSLSPAENEPRKENIFTKFLKKIKD